MNKMTFNQLAVNMLAYEAVVDENTSQAAFFSDIKELGISKIEVRREYVHGQDDLMEIKNKAAELGIELFYAVPETLFEGGQLLTLDKLEGFFKEAQFLGVKQVKFTAGYTTELVQEEVAKLKQLLNTHGIENLTLENGQDPSFARAETVKKFVQLLKEQGLPVTITFDTGNCLYVEENPLESFILLKEDVSYVHLKDVSKATLTPTLNGEGDVPTKAILEQVAESVNVAIEYPLGATPTETLKQEIDKIV